MFECWCLKWRKDPIVDCQPVLQRSAGKGYMVMKRLARLSPRARFRSKRLKNALTITVTLMFLGLLCGTPRLDAQSLSQNGIAVPTPGGQQFPGRDRSPAESPAPEPFPKTSQKRKKALMDYNFKKLKQHAQDLAELAKSLQTEIEKSNENVLSLEIVKKAEQAEKLAKKIKDEAKGY